MKNRYIITCLLATTIFFSACKKDVLDIAPTNQVNDVLLWSNQAMVLTYTANFYSQLNSGFTAPYIGAPIYTSNLLSDITDDATVNNTTYSAFWNGAYSSSTSPVNVLWTGSRWQYIRQANTFLQKIDAVPGDTALNHRMKGEIKFLRAYYYFDLINYFGAVPIITTPQNEVDSTAFVPRATSAQCTDFLVSELTAAANLLPKTYAASDWGRITKGAALAMLCRVQLYAGRWADAAATAKSIMNLNTYSLVSSYSNVFSVTNKMNSEIILSVQNNGNASQLYNYFDLYNQPPAFTGRGETLPTQNLVDDYQMQATGLPITDPASGYNPQNPYVGRDPRFAATILYDGATFRGRTMQLYNGGIDLTQSIVPSFITNTGYYLLKFTDQTIDLTNTSAVSSQNWILFRYAEVLLNYAEAQNEAVGPDATVYAAMNAIRQRAGMPVLPTGLSQTDMRTAIYHERRIELAFEDERYWDVKRWKQATTLFSSTTNPIRKMTIVLNPTTGVKTYTISNLPTVRVFLDKHYLFPIPYTELTKPGSKLVQNPGW